MLLQVLMDMLPSDAKLPKDHYEAKKIVRDLGLGYEKIHACPNNCILFWKENSLHVLVAKFQGGKQMRQELQVIMPYLVRERRKLQRSYDGSL